MASMPTNTNGYSLVLPLPPVASSSTSATSPLRAPPAEEIILSTRLRQVPSTPMQTGLANRDRASVAGQSSVNKRSAKNRGAKAKGKAPLVEDVILNSDYCAACGGIGRFLCCDGCPKSFHFMCLEPPLALDEMPAEDEWYCKECKTARRPKNAKLPPMIAGPFGPLIRRIETINPTEYSLPESFQTYFANTLSLKQRLVVVKEPNGAFKETVDLKPIKFDRSGFPEDRDNYRLRHRGKPILCYRCKGSAAPEGPGVSQGLSLGRRILSCDYCPAHWHVDCLDPPITTLPNPQKKWMCPIHAKKVAPKKRTLRNGVQEITVTKPGQRNNGNITILSPEDERRRIAYELRYINGKRYKIPEQIIRLDFWAKISKSRRSNEPSTPPATSHTIESLFGGQSPLSTAPSSPVLPPESEPMILEPISGNDQENPSSDDTAIIDALMGLRSERSSASVMPEFETV